MSRDNNWILPEWIAICALVAIHNSNICRALASIAGAITGDRKEKLASYLKYLTTPRLSTLLPRSSHCIVFHDSAIPSVYDPPLPNDPTWLHFWERSLRVLYGFFPFFCSQTVIFSQQVVVLKKISTFE